MPTCYLLTGDIGGTNSRMALYEAETPCTSIAYGTKPLCANTYRNEVDLPEAVRSDPAAFQKFIISPFLQYCWETIPDVLCPLEESEIIGCLATAGLVLNNAVRITNLNFLVVDGTAIQQDCTDEYLRHVTLCQVINDFVAQGYGCLTLTPSDVKHLYGPDTGLDPTKPGDYRGPKVCVGAGTGLGECYLTPDSSTGKYTCFPSEGGHVEFAPRNDLEMNMWQYLMKKFESKHRVSVERVVSGIGLANVYEFLSVIAYTDRAHPKIQQEFLNSAADKRGEVVGKNALKDSLCREAMEILMAAYGCEVGCAAIKFIPTGGLFVTGGITPKNLHFIDDLKKDFMLSYLHKGRVSPVLECIPLYAVLTEDLGVRGVHKAATMLYEKSQEEHSRSSKEFPLQSFRLLVAVGSAVITTLMLDVIMRTKRR